MRATFIDHFSDSDILLCVLCGLDYIILITTLSDTIMPSFYKCVD